jgi:hypothetical protein
MYMLAGGICSASRVNKWLKVTEEEALRGILNSGLLTFPIIALIGNDMIYSYNGIQYV